MPKEAEYEWEAMFSFLTLNNGKTVAELAQEMKQQGWKLYDGALRREKREKQECLSLRTKQ